MTLFVCTFIALVWLREQVNVGNGVQDIHAAPVARLPPENDLELEARRVLREQIGAILPNEEPLVDPLNNAEAEVPAQNEVPAEPVNENRGQNMEQFVENMTWQRLLGLDGSFVFIENVFWVISLNFVFHVVFRKSFL